MTNVLKVALLTGVALLAGHASAFIPWSNPTMSQGSWDLRKGGSDFGLCGSPQLNVSTLEFFPFNFTTSSSGGGSSTITDRVVFEVTDSSGSGYVFTSISVTENGTYSTAGLGTVLSTPVVNVTNLTSNSVFTTNMSVTYIAGMWVATGTVTIPPLGWFSGDWLRIEIFNTLTATTYGVGDSATIDKSSVQRDLHGGLEASIIPAPASILPLIAALALRRRR